MPRADIEQKIADGRLGGAYRPITVARYINEETAFLIAEDAVIIGYDDVEDAIRIANDTKYGLSAYVHAGTIEKAAEVGARIRAGQVYLNGDMDILDPTLPFGGFKMSGNGRECGDHGFEAFLEVKALVGYNPQ